MVTNLTLGKEKYAAVQDDMAEIKASSEKLRDRAGGAGHARRPGLRRGGRGHEAAHGRRGAEEGARSRVLQAALKGAAEVPLKVAEAAAEVARLSLPAAEKGNPNAVSDAGVAVLLADAAAQSAALNVKINLAWIEDEDFKRDAWARIEAVLSETARLRDVVLALTYSKI